MADKLGIGSKILDENDKEDLALLLAIKEGDKEDFVSRQEVFEELDS